jgi:multiple sugar transport system permease protein
VMRLGKVAIDLAVVIALLLAILPFAFMVLTSIQKSSSVSLAFDPAKLDLSNYTRLFTEFGFGPAIATSAIVVVLACVVNLTVASMAAYGFSKRPFPGSEGVFLVYLATMMVPVQVTLIPLFVLMRQLGLLNSYFSLFLPIISAFGVFLIRQFMDSIPDELIEAARLDGANEIRIYWQLAVPLSRPVLISLAVFTFIGAWNDFLWPLVSITDAQLRTVTLAAANLQGSELGATNYGLVMAGAAVSFAVPLIVYFAIQRQFVQGVAATGLKG